MYLIYWVPNISINSQNFLNILLLIEFSMSLTDFCAHSLSTSKLIQAQVVLSNMILPLVKDYLTMVTSASCGS